MTQNKIVSIIGHKGFGKTKLTELLVMLNNKPTIVADPRYQYSSKPYRRHFKNVNHFRKYIMNRNNLKEFYRCKLELVINGLDHDNFNDLSDIVLKLKNISFLVDEVDMFAPPTMTYKANFYKLIHYGRHNQIDIFTTSRRPANISRNLTSQTDVFLFSRVREPSDKLYLANYVGKQHVATASNLSRFNFLLFDDNEKPIVINISKRLSDAV
jgi:ABC-type cobalamin/Fe3+-siderophores transport system ATPase subunit